MLQVLLRLLLQVSVLMLIVLMMEATTVVRWLRLLVMMVAWARTMMRFGGCACCGCGVRMMGMAASHVP